MRRAVPARATRGSFHEVEVSQLGEDNWVVRAPGYDVLSDALAAVGRPAERTRVEVGALLARCA